MNINKHRKYLFLVFIVLVILPFSCITRLQRPKITGKVLDYENNPISGCKIGESMTDKNGFFTLPAITYKAFFLTEIFQMEAPPLMVYETVKKNGYEDGNIEMFHKYGGGLSKETIWDIGIIYLKKKNQTINISKVLSGKMKMSLTKENDTIFIVNEEILKYSVESKNSSFYGKYERYTDNYLQSFGPNNLPDGIIRKEVLLNIIKNQIKMETIIQYGDKDGNPDKFKKKDNDTILNNGTWQMTNTNELQFKTNSTELSGNYKISDYDMFYIQLIKQ